MAEKFDVTSRLAEGRHAVDNIETYVWACHVLGHGWRASRGLAGRQRRPLA